MAREVGTEGKLGGQAEVEGVAGTWKDLTDNVNLMAGNLTAQVRNIAQVTTAVANGDLSKKITVDVKGEILELKDTINTMVDQLNSFAERGHAGRARSRHRRQARRQAVVPGVAGTWKDLTDSVNIMAGNLTAQVRNIAEVTTAVANGDLRKKITVDVKGEISRVEEHDQHDGRPAQQLRRRGDPRRPRGRHRGQAGRPGAMSRRRRHLEGPDRLASTAWPATSPARSATSPRSPPPSPTATCPRRSPSTCKGEILELKNTINTMVDQLNSFAAEVTRVAREVGTEGKLGRPGPGARRGRHVEGPHRQRQLDGRKPDGQVRNIAEVTTAVANGDLSKKITVDVKGEILELKNTINTMVDQLNSFASEVTRVAREVGTEGQARRPGRR